MFETHVVALGQTRPKTCGAAVSKTRRIWDTILIAEIDMILREILDVLLKVG